MKWTQDIKPGTKEGAASIPLTPLAKTGKIKLDRPGLLQLRTALRNLRSY
jgi:hypothetical protein